MEEGVALPKISFKRGARKNFFSRGGYGKGELIFKGWIKHISKQACFLVSYISEVNH